MAKRGRHRAEGKRREEEGQVRSDMGEWMLTVLWWALDKGVSRNWWLV